MTETSTDLLQRFHTTTQQLTELIKKFDHETFNHKPADDKWSAGEVTEHLLIFDTRMNQILEDATHPTDRNISEKMEEMFPKVSDRKNKIDAPKFMIPSPGIKSSEELLEKIMAERDKIFKAIEEKDLSLHSKQFPHRFYGEMTAYEWLNLVDLHTKRHLEQLDELLHLKG
jgi:hypothetical protein